MVVPAPPAQREWPVAPDVPAFDLPAIGVIAGAEEACIAVERLMLRWLPSYCAALVEAGGPPLGPLVRSEQLPDASQESTWGTPAMFVSSPGTIGTPTRRRGTFRAVWQVNVTIGDRGADWGDTRRILQRWAGLIRTIQAQHRGLEGYCSGSNWLGESYNRGQQLRTLGFATVAFSVEMAGISDLSADPIFPITPGDAPGTDPLGDGELDLTLTRIDTEAS